jgi:hypothetical protein
MEVNNITSNMTILGVGKGREPNERTIKYFFRGTELPVFLAPLVASQNIAPKIGPYQRLADVPTKLCGLQTVQATLSKE